MVLYKSAYDMAFTWLCAMMRLLFITTPFPVSLSSPLDPNGYFCIDFVWGENEFWIFRLTKKKN